MKSTTAPQIEVVARAFFIPEQSAPELARYVFGYTVQIRNTGSIPAKLLSRHWIITDGHDRVQEVKGEGVVGEQPRLEPGEAFNYTSGAVLETPVGSMRGFYNLVTDEGAAFSTEIPAFLLASPRSVH